MGLLKALTYNYKKLLKAFFLIIICIYSWSLIGLLIFDSHYERVNIYFNYKLTLYIHLHL